MVPAEIVIMEKLPVLGTGKIDTWRSPSWSREMAATAAKKPSELV